MVNLSNISFLASSMDEREKRSESEGERERKGEREKERKGSSRSIPILLLSRNRLFPGRFLFSARTYLCL